MGFDNPSQSVEQGLSHAEKAEALHRLRQPGADIDAVVAKVGLHAVIEELEELCHEDSANLALEYGLKMQEMRIVQMAASIIMNSGGYSEKTEELAKQYVKKV